jgi:hypothetical protein
MVNILSQVLWTRALPTALAGSKIAEEVFAGGGR